MFLLNENINFHFLKIVLVIILRYNLLQSGAAVDSVITLQYIASNLNEP